MNDISVVIPTYNRRHLLSRALDSVIAQTHAVGEIIVVDDGSTDGTDEFITRHYPDVVYVKQQHKGVSHARNTGIRHTSRHWIALLDSDDQWLPEKTEIQLAALRKAPSHKIIHGNEIWIRHGRRVNPMKKHQKQGGWIYPQCLPLCVISPSAVIIHREIFDTVGLFDENLPACEDYDLWLRICASFPVLYIEQPLIHKYGGHDDQLSRQHWGMDRFRIHALQKMLETNVLEDDQQFLTAEMLVEKARILANGARKRGKSGDAKRYHAIAEQYLSLTRHCMTA